jgi:hypothetical protein
MTLSTEVIARVSSALLIELTNQGSTTATTVNTTLLGHAASDAEQEFLVETGLTFDASKPLHVAACISGVLYYLHSYTGIQSERQESIKARWQQWLAKAARAVGGERRLMPQTSSVKKPSTPVTNALPDNDRTRWRRVVPNMPFGDVDQIGERDGLWW